MRDLARQLAVYGLTEAGETRFRVDDGVLLVVFVLGDGGFLTGLFECS